MTIDWILLFASALVLWLPASLLYPVEARERLSEHFGSRYRVPSIFLTWQHWLDAVRGFGGAYFLVNYAVSYTNGGGERGGFYETFAVHAAVLAIAVVLQTVHYRRVVYCVAPIAFLIGVTFALSDWQAALFASVFGLLALKLGNLEVKFPLMAVLLGISGYFISGKDLHLILNCVLLVFPLVLVYIAQTTFVIYTRQLVK